MVFAAKCFWPQVTGAELQRISIAVDVEARSCSREGRRVSYLGTLGFLSDELVLCLFQATAAADVTHVSQQAGVPCERLMRSLWIPGRELERSKRCTRS
jgi:hypothetical protein